MLFVPKFKAKFGLFWNSKDLNKCWRLDVGACRNSLGSPITSALIPFISHKTTEESLNLRNESANAAQTAQKLFDTTQSQRPIVGEKNKVIDTSVILKDIENE